MKINNNIDYSTRDYEGFRTDMIKGLQQRIPEYTDTSQSDSGIVILELLAHGLDLLSYYNDKTSNEVYLDTARERENIINLAKMMGYTFNDGRPSQFEQVFEILPQEEEFIIPRGYIVKTVETSVEPSILFETDDDLVIPPNCTGTEQDSEGNYLYSVTVTQGYSVDNEIVGTSNETPNQSFKLSVSPVIKDSISLMITESNGEEEEWTRVETFLDSSPNDKHFMVNIDASNRGIITFGNGNSGKIPSAREDGIVASYRIGGGEVGNVSARTIKVVDQKLAGIINTFNPSSALVQGIDKEDDEIIKLKAKSHFKTTWGAITLEDYAEIVKAQSNILDATSTTGETKFDIIVNVLPYNYSEMTQEDLKSIKEGLLNIFQKRRLLGVDVYLEFAEKVNIHPTITLNLYPNAYKKDIMGLVDNVMKGSFNTDDSLLGENLHPSEIITELMQIDGVKTVACEIEDLPSEVTSNQVINIESYSLNLIGGI